MKNFTPTDKLETLRVGDTLTLADGTVHEAQHTANDDCDDCSINKYHLKACYAVNTFIFQCKGFHFIKLKP